MKRNLYMNCDKIGDQLKFNINYYDNAKKNVYVPIIYVKNQLMERITTLHTTLYNTYNNIRRQLQANAIREVLQKPSCGGDAGGPFESKPQIMQTIAEVHVFGNTLQREKS